MEIAHLFTSSFIMKHARHGTEPDASVIFILNVAVYI